MKLPPLPKMVYSMLGPVPVTYLSDKEMKDDLALCGKYSYGSRSINVAPDMSLESQWATLFHEIVHLALMDAGASNVLTKKKEEVVCDAIGGHLAAMMRAGSLKIPANWKATPMP